MRKSFMRKPFIPIEELAHCRSSYANRTGRPAPHIDLKRTLNKFFRRSWAAPTRSMDDEVPWSRQWLCASEAMSGLTLAKLGMISHSWPRPSWSMVEEMERQTRSTVIFMPGSREVPSPLLAAAHVPNNSSKPSARTVIHPWVLGPASCSSNLKQRTSQPSAMQERFKEFMMTDFPEPAYPLRKTVSQLKSISSS